MFKVVKYTNIGGRQENEDAHDLFYDNGRLCVVVADGLGGHGGGAKASQTAVEFIGKKFVEQKEDFLQNLNENMEELNSEICSKQTKLEKMRTTIAVLVIEKDLITTAHIGDTRIYHFLNNNIADMTFDHSVSQMAVLSGEIKQEEIRHHIDRNKLLRSLGKSDGIRTEINSWGDAKNGKHAFLLCTDGFWENIDEQEMIQCLKESTGPKEWMSKMTKIIKSRIGDDSDNYTAVAAWKESLSHLGTEE